MSTHADSSREAYSLANAKTHDSELQRKSDLCAAALLEARRLSGVAMFSALFAQIMGRVENMLEELDEALRTPQSGADSSVASRVAALHEGYAELLYRRDHLGV